MTKRFRIILSAACAAVALVGCLAYAHAVRSQAERVRVEAIERFGGEVASLVVADEALEAGDVVSEQNVSVRDWVSDLAPEGAVARLDEVIGRELTVPVAKGAPLAELNFRDASELADVPAGRVAVGIPVTDRLGISHGVTRGTHLSAYVVEDDAPRLIASDVEALSELGATSGLSMAQQVTVAVLPKDVTAMLGAASSGDLRLVVPADDVTLKAENDRPEPPAEVAPKKGER